MLIFRNPNKFNSKLRLLAPFVMMLDGLIELVLLPTPFSSYLYNKYLHTIIKADMKYRIKFLADKSKLQT